MSTQIQLGRLVKAIGLRGELKLLQSEDYWTEALQSAHLQLVRGSERRAVAVLRVRDYGARTVAVHFDGVDDRNGAEALIGSDLLLEADELDVEVPPKALRFQLLGLEVTLPDGQRLGKVVDVLKMPANDVFVVRGEDKEYLIPDAPHVIEELDVERKSLRIRPLPGLLEL